ncbi:MAG: L-rhamnose isomerase [Anaerolineae bacterium]|nr:L-rhamnose isomerase [Anaerolineae bacterium]
MNEKEFEIFCELQEKRGVNIEQIKAVLKAQCIETPSWGYGDSGTRFKVFHWPGAARNIYEKLADAAFVHKLTGIAPSVALHIPWDKVDDWEGLKQYASELGIKLGAINPNLFQDDEYKLGSLCHPNPVVRQKAIEHVLECIEICKITGSKAISLWLADGTNYPGQDNFIARKQRLEETLAEIYRFLPEGVRLLIEYKFFEPAFYHTDIPDWGMAYLLALKLGPQAQVLIDLGHHPQGTNVEHIVAILLSEGKMGGFHFNNRKYADDDLIIGSINPFELFLIFNELAGAALSENPVIAECAKNVLYMIDQSHNIEDKIEAMILSIINCQNAYAKALLVNREALAQAQKEGDVLKAHRLLLEAYETDVRPLLRQVRIEMGVPPDPVEAYRASGYRDKIASERSSPADKGYLGA